MKEFPDEKAKVIKQYDMLQQLYSSDRVQFEFEVKKAIEKVISEAENDNRRNNLEKMQTRLNIGLNT